MEKRKYRKPRMRSISAETNYQLMAGSAAFNVTTNLSGLGGYGGGRNASLGD